MIFLILLLTMGFCNCSHLYDQGFSDGTQASTAKEGNCLAHTQYCKGWVDGFKENGGILTGSPFSAEEQNVPQK